MSDRQHPFSLFSIVVRVVRMVTDVAAVVVVLVVGVFVVLAASVDDLFVIRPGFGVVFGIVRGVVRGVRGVVFSVIDIIFDVADYLHRERSGSVRSRTQRRSTGRSALAWAGRLLPDAMKEEYIEEWQAWLSDLQETGEPWYRRTTELLVIVLVAAPRLAIICRWGARRAVDR